MCYAKIAVHDRSAIVWKVPRPWTVSGPDLIRTRVDDGTARVENIGMSTHTNISPSIPPDILADGEAVIQAALTGTKLDSDLVRRVRHRAERVTEEVRVKYGILDIGAGAIRGLRDK